MTASSPVDRLTEFYRSEDQAYETDMNSAALLVVDVQNGSMLAGYGYGKFYSAIGMPELNESRLERTPRLVAKIRTLIEAFRSAERPVAYCTVAYAPGYADLHKRWWPRLELCRQRGIEPPFAVKGSFEAQVVEGLGRLHDEPLFEKNTAGAFASTALGAYLRERSIESLFVVGVATNYCVETTVREAADRDFACFVVEDGCDAATPERHALGISSLESVARITTVDDVLDMLERG